MNNELLAVVSYLERDRGVSREIIVQAIESAIQQSAKHSLDVSDALRVSIDRRTLEIKAHDTLTVSSTKRGPGYIHPTLARRFTAMPIEGSSIEIEIPTAKLGRIAATSARQMILQKIREAERKNVYDEFKNRVGDIVNGTVKHIDRRDLYIDLGRCEAVMPAKERIPTEEYNVGDTVRAYVYRVAQNDKGPSIILSRACPEFVKTLFSLEVSEIADGIVEIMSVARDPGFRSKIAVKTMDDKIDPIGACVGQRGSRVHNIMRELNGEKIDIVRWSSDICDYVAHALQPARLESIEIAQDAPRTIYATVSPDQLSLAIGKRGQNVRLTTKLTGWRVNIEKTAGQESFAEQRQSAIRRLSEVLEISDETAQTLVDNGFLTPDGVLASDEPYIAQVCGFDPATTHSLFVTAQAVVDARQNYSEA